MVLSSQPLIFWIWFYWKNLYLTEMTIFYIFFPLIFFAGVFILIISSIMVSKIFLLITNLIHPPQEGVFYFNKDDKDFCYWSLRSVIKKWPIWLSRQLSLPFFEMLAYNILGVKTSFKNALHDGWVDCELVTLGKNVRIGQGTVIMSNLIVKGRLIFKRVVIKDDVIIGAHSLILPGTIIEPNTILDSNSITKIDQHLDSNSIYRGRPVKKVLETSAITNKEVTEKRFFEKDPSVTQTAEFLTAQGTNLSVPFHFYIISGTIIIGFSFFLPGFIFYSFLFGVLAPYLFSQPFTVEILLNPYNYGLLFLTPLIIISCYLLHLFFVALFTRWFYKLADKRGPSQGIFDRNLETSSTTLDYYHFRSFLMKYPVFAFSRSPFPWLLNWELNFIKSNKIGKGTVLEETFIHSHINFGDNCYLGTSSHITNHLVDGVYGEENLIFVGVEIGNRSILNATTGGLPGSEVGENSTLLPGCTTLKYDKLDGDGVYTGFPAKRMKKEDIIDYLGGDYSGE